MEKTTRSRIKSRVSTREAKALTRQITGHNDLLSSRDGAHSGHAEIDLELDESVTNAIEIRQMQQAELVAAVSRKCSRHQGVPPGDEVGASRPCEATCEQADGLPARQPFGFTRECGTSVSREVRDDAILRVVEVPFEGSTDVCEVVYIAGDADETSEAVLQDIMTKFL